LAEFLSPASDGDERPAGPAPPSGDGSVAAHAALSTVWTLAAQIVQTVLGFGVTVVLTIWLHPEDYGLFGMASTVVVFLSIFGDGALGQALIRRQELDPTVETTAFALTVMGGFALGVASLIAAPFLGLYFRNGDVGVMAAAVAASFVILAPGRVSYAKLMRHLRFRAMAITGIAATGTGAVVAVLAAHQGLGGWSLAISFLAAPIATTAAYLALAPPRLGWRLYSRSCARELSGLGAHLSGYAIAVCLAWLPWTLALGRVTGAAAVGLFAMGSRIVVTSVDKIGAAFTQVFFPNVAKQPLAERERSYLMALRLLAACTAPAALGCLAVADELVTVLPSRWSDLAHVIKALAIGATVEPLFPLATVLLVANGQSRIVLRLGLFTIPTVWLGVAVAAWSGALSTFVVMWSAINVVIAVVFLATALGGWRGAPKILKAAAPPVLAAALMAAAVELLQRVTGTAGRKQGLPLGIVAGAILHPAILLLLMKQDTLRVWRLLSSAAGRVARRRSPGHA
jgi:O-antigen/teichoic acid export membrane protein